MDNHLGRLLVAFVAAFIAGMVNSVAGGGTLISFPALVWIGIDPQAANVTNTVTLWPGSLGGIIGFRRELGGSRRWMLLLGGPSVAGGVLGAYWLLKTDPTTFAAIVPYLILFATVLFALQEPVSRRLRRSEPGTSDRNEAPRPHGLVWRIGAVLFQFSVAVYGGYFGAGIGILMLAALSVLGHRDIHQMNGLKNVLAFCINVAAAVYFILRGPVRWNFAVVMAVGAMAGGYGGAGLGRKLGRVFVRRFVIMIGLAMAISLLLRRP